MATPWNPKLLPLAAIAVVALVLFALLPMARDSDADVVLVSTPVALAPATMVRDTDTDVVELEQWAASAPPPSTVETKPSPAAGRRVDPPVAVVAVAAPAPTTIRRVVVTKGSRVVRNIPVAPPVAATEAQPVPRAVRFNMSQDGKRMTADEFDAWMKAQGIRVASGPPKPATPVIPPPLPAPSVPAPSLPLPSCVPGTDAGC